MTNQEFLRISGYLKEKYGIDMSRKQEIVRGRMENYIRNGGWDSYTQYMNELQRDTTGRLEKELVNLLTTNHTYFMREWEHFDFLKDYILPELKRKESATKDLCIWCGASSTGEEPYTLAMILQDFFGLEKSQWDTHILATDISSGALQHAVQGIYTAEQVKTLPEPWKKRFFQKVNQGSEYQVKEFVRQEVIFRKFNLMDAFPFRRKMHVIFLRNVMIYFDGETKERLIRKLYDIMEPGGYLFVGKTETIDRNVVPFQMVRPSVFQKGMFASEQ